MSALENKEDDAAWERMESELSRLRDLVREMRGALMGIYSDFEFCKADGDTYGDRAAVYAETARAAVAKIDATIKGVVWSEWVPIESAPLDGTVVFVSGVGCNGRFYTDAKWHREWLMFHPEDDAYTMPIGGLTHFMPIPDVPSQAEDAALKESGHE